MKKIFNKDSGVIILLDVILLSLIAINCYISLKKEDKDDPDQEVE